MNIGDPVWIIQREYFHRDPPKQARERLLAIIVDVCESTDNRNNLFVLSVPSKPRWSHIQRFKHEMTELTKEEFVLWKLENL